MNCLNTGLLQLLAALVPIPDRTASAALLSIQEPATAEESDVEELGERHLTDNWFGMASVWLDDVDGDGWHDLAVPGPSFARGEGNGGSTGMVLLLSGKDGRVLRVLAPRPGEVFFGFGLAVGDDLDGDGVGELAIWGGARGNRVGFVRLVSPRDGRVHWEYTRAPGFTHVHGIERIDDKNGDGVRDLVAWGNDPRRSEEDGIQIYQVLSGADGIRVSEHRLEESAWLRITDVRPVGDLDQDGSEDLAVCTYVSGSVRAERVELRSGAAGTLLQQISIDRGRGLDVEASDVDGDGADELLLVAEKGSVRISENAEPISIEPGEVLVLNLAPLSLKGKLSARDHQGKLAPVASLSCLAGTTETPLLLYGVTGLLYGAVHALDPGSDRRVWTLGRAEANEEPPTDLLNLDHLGEFVTVDPAPSEEGRRAALTGTANPWGDHEHVLVCFDPRTATVRFVVDAPRLYAEAGL